MKTEHLQRRGHQYYLKLGVPRPLQHFFRTRTGKPMVTIEQPLGDSYEQARNECARRVANYRELFARLHAGEQLTPEQIKAELSMSAAEFDRVRQEHAAAMRQILAGIREDTRGVFADLMPKTTSPLDRARVLGALDVMGGARPTGETISQAAEAWFADMTRDPAAAPQGTTLDGHRLRVRAFVDKYRDLPLTDVTRAMASDFLGGLAVANRTRNAYATTLRCVFDCARKRGRFTGDNPFDDQKAKVAGSSYVPFTDTELQTLFGAMPHQTKPKKHTPDTALPWVALIALYTGARLEEIAQLTTADIREEAANGATVTVIDIHNGGTNKLKNETSERLIPVHSELVRAGLLDYVKALPAGPLFPGLTRRASKGGKVGARLGELFRKKLVALGLKREGLCFHSLRHTVAGRLDAAGVPQSDAARVLGHAVAGMSYGIYSQAGPGLKRVAATVEQVRYEGLRI
jgi:integrase